MEQEVTFPSQSPIQIGGTLLSADAPSAVILLSDSGAHDRNESLCGHQPFRVIAEYLHARGHTVLRFDDRGVGASTGDPTQTSFAASVTDALAAARFLAAPGRPPHPPRP